MPFTRKAPLAVWLLSALLAATAVGAQDGPTPRGAWYRDSVVNVHFDNHSALLGKGVPPEDLAAMLGSLPVTMLQVSAQSNRWATYPTAVALNNPNAGGYDTLATFREIARRSGKKLCVYMSVDRRPEELKAHPEWLCRNAAGQQEANGEPTVCQRPNRERKGYLYERFLPQIREITRKYDPAGFWFDGDYHYTRPCWCERCLKEWQADTGLEAPRRPDSPHWKRWLAWNQERYSEYRRLVADAIHSASPTALYTSNWSWAWTPEPVPEFVDTLSGDAWSIRQVHAVTQRWGAQEKPWDVMSYCVPISRAYGRGYSLQRTLQEGALTMASGGVWFLWSFGGGKVPPYAVEVTRSLAHFARDRQAALGPSTSLSQVAVLDSETAWLAGGESGSGSRVHNTARSLAEAHYLTDIVNEQTFRAVGKRYSVLLVPEHRVVAPETLAALQSWVRDGGLLLLTGGALRGEGEEPPAVSALLGAKRVPPADKRLATLALGREKQFLSGAWTVDAGPTRVVARFADGRPALTAHAVGTGTVAYLATDIPFYPDDGLFAAALRALGHGPSYTLSGGAGQAALLCSLRGKPGQVILHLTDLSARVGGNQVDVDTAEYTDFNPPLHNVKVTLPIPEAPARVRAVPAGTLVSTEYQDGKLTVTLDTFQTHAAVILDTRAPAPLALLPAQTPEPAAAFHPANDRAGVVFADDFEGGAPGQPPSRPWAPENRSGTAIAITGDGAARGARALQFTETEGSSFFPFLHRSVAPFRRGRARLSFDLRAEAGVDCLIEARYEGKGPGPSVRLDGEGRLIAGGKELATLTPGAWHHLEIEFTLGGEKPSYSVAVTAPGAAARVFPDLPYASEWFFLCDSIYFVGSGQKPGRFFLDNVAFERLTAR